jgi:hypothetical protein
MYGGWGQIDCPEGQSYNPSTGVCELVLGGETIKPCPPGQVTDPVTLTCKSIEPKRAGMGPLGWAAVAAAVLVGVAVVFAKKKGAPRRGH